MGKIGIGVIGYGGRIETVLRNTLKGGGEEVALKAVFDPSERSIAAVREQFGNQVAICASYEELCKRCDVDWVVIGSWNCFHRDQTLCAFANGKHVYCEKPLATSVDDCLAMVKAQRETGLHFMTGYVLRYSPHYQKLKQVIGGGAIGEIVSMEFNETLDWNHGGFIHGDWRRHSEFSGSHLLEKCCHDMDLVTWLVGSRPARIASFGGLGFFKPAYQHRMDELGTDANGKAAYCTWRTCEQATTPFTDDKDIVDHQVAILAFENEVKATFHTNCNGAIPERRMLIYGTEGTIRADVITGSIELRKIGFETEIEQLDSGASGGHGGGDHILGQNIADVMLGKDVSLTSVEDGLVSAFTCFAMDEAMETGKVVELAPYWEQLESL